MPPREFQALADQLEEARRSVWLAQCAPRWAEDDEWAKLRDRIDDALLRRLLLKHDSLEVHRVVLYDLPEGMREGPAGDRHRAWVARLRRDQANLGSRAVYRIRQIVLGTKRPDNRPPRDLAVIDAEDAFKDLVNRKGFVVEPTEVMARDPYPDQDPLYFLDLDVRDTDRLQLGLEQRRRRQFAREAEPEL